MATKDKLFNAKENCLHKSKLYGYGMNLCWFQIKTLSTSKSMQSEPEKDPYQKQTLLGQKTTLSRLDLIKLKQKFMKENEHYQHP